MRNIPEDIDLARLPLHIAIIMDGNGRWAKKKGMPRVFGHRNGVKAVREVSEGAAELGVKFLTLYAFSTENWNRPKLEITALMTLLVETVRKEVKTLNENNIKLEYIGDIQGLPEKSQQALKEGVEHTKKNTGLTLILALNYSSRWEITQSMKKIGEMVKDGKIEPSDIDEKTISQHLATARYPDPELMIRTSGEMRISNYLLWQLAYSELYFTDVFWPDFRKEHFFEAIRNYQRRERRFGKISEQIKT